MANRSNQRRRRRDATPPTPTLTLTEIEASHHADDHRAFILKFCGTRINVTVTNKAEAVRRWITNTRYANKNHLRRNRLIVGLGLGDEINEDPASTVHLCVGTNCLIIQLDQIREARRRLRTRVPPILANHFGDESIQFVGIFNGGHANKLEKAGIQVANIHDVNDSLPCQENRSYKQWSKPELDGPQISQAAADAFVRYKIGVKQGVR
ncbi:unnamed protein product [Brassica napus]|uniref:(rape) hypothetical protein n=1 Tax=Brassica napus TaxID=3708 RepID=A0A816SG11_BRANA|nr:unnamed protein product [Brassica napus]